MSQLYSVQEPRSTSPSAETRHMLSSWSHTFHVWLNRRRLQQDLSELDDRLLDDVGLSRKDVLLKNPQAVLEAMSLRD